MTEPFMTKQQRELIAILRGITVDEVAPISEVLMEAGISRIEVPLNSPKPLASIERMVTHFSGRASIGAGTVLTVEQVQQVAASGCDFVVSPNCSQDVIKATKTLGMNSYPGVFTPTECFNALQAGADALKLFPANVLGPSGLKAIRTILPANTKVYVVGGVEPDNLALWRSSGATGFGLGTSLYCAGDSPDKVKTAAQKAVMNYDRLPIKH